MNIYKKAALLCALILGFSLPSDAQAASVANASDEKITQIIDRLTERKVLFKDSEPKLQLEDDISHAVFIELLLRNGGFDPSKEAAPRTKNLDDVEVSHPQYGFIQKALSLDIEEARGKNGASYFPSSSLGRVQGLIMAMKLEGIFAPRIFEAKKVKFTDVHPESWFARYIAKAHELKLLLPLTENEFKPFNRFTVRETLYFLDRIETVKNKKAASGTIVITQTKSDLPDIPHFDKIPEIWSNIDDDFLYQERIDKNKIGEDVLKTIVNSLNDPYSSFRPSGTVSKSLETNSEDNSAGIGAQVTLKDGKIIIIAPFKDSPAEKAGLQTNDAIVKVDGKSLENLTLTEALNLVKGPKGTSVRLTIEREGRGNFDVIVVRDTLPSNSVFYDIFDTIGYIQITLFKNGTPDELDKIVKEINTIAGLSGVIIDVRTNPGGILEVAQSVSSHFLETGKVITTIKNVHGGSTKYLSEPRTKLKNVPIVLITDKGSASAAEILALALKSHNRAHILGETSYGKGTVQKLFLYEDNSEFQFTIAQWFGPKDESINGTGVVPDTVVTDGSRTPSDVRLNKALELIRSGALN